MIMTNAQKLYSLYCDFLREICMIETPSSDKVALDKLADFIQDFAERRGFAVERIPFLRAGDCLKIFSENKFCEEQSPFMLMAHMDTVHPKGVFGDNILKEDDDVWTAPGIIDCKGGIAVALMSMELLSLEGFSKRPIELLLTSDEEISGTLSSPDGIELITNEAKKAYAVLNCETGRSGVLTVGRKGIAKLRLRIYGKSSHAGNAYFEGISAIVEAAHQIIRITELSSENGSTFNCGIIQGGTVINAVPDYCEVMVDVRDMTVKGLYEAVEKVRYITQTPKTSGTHTEIEIIGMRPPMEHKAENDTLLAGINCAARACGYSEFLPVIRGGGSDSAYTVQVGAPTICSCGLEGYGEHTADERGEIKSLISRACILAEAMLNYL